MTKKQWYGGQNIQYSASGLKCDNPKCDWKDESIKLDDYDDWLDKPCPKCGEVVLTHEDLGYLHMMIEIADVLNGLDIPLDPNEEKVEMSVDVHNKKIEIKPEDGKDKKSN